MLRQRYNQSIEQLTRWWEDRIIEIKDHAAQSVCNFLDGVGWSCPYVNPIWRRVWFKAFRQGIKNHYEQEI